MKLKELAVVCNGDIAEKIYGREDWVLYICDHYWVLDIDGYMEFYYNPLHFLGKVSKEELPVRVINAIKSRCVRFDKKRLTNNGTTPLESSRHNTEQLEEQMILGNRFYGQGYIYFTCAGRFYREIAPYEMKQTCALSDIDTDILRDMLNMSASTRTHYYIKSIYDLDCFTGTDTSGIIPEPLEGLEWDSATWKYNFDQISRELREYNNSNAREEMRTLRKDVYMHTLLVTKKGYYYKNNGEKVILPDCSEMIKNSRFYSARMTPPEGEIYDETEITVKNTDCLVAAKALLDEGFRPAVLNMANRQTPGGGVYNGAGAQEENLFRRTNLYKSLYQYSSFAKLYGIPAASSSYPMDRNFGGVYSPEVTVFKGEEKDGYPLLDDYYKVAVISVAGMNRPELDAENRIVSHLIEGVKNKIRTILNIALENSHDCIVLGALGCGAYRNPPAHIAEIFHEVIETEYKNRFRKICFAVLEDHNSVRKDSKQGNFLPFYEEFCK